MNPDPEPSSSDSSETSSSDSRAKKKKRKKKKKRHKHWKDDSLDPYSSDYSDSSDDIPYRRKRRKKKKHRKKYPIKLCATITEKLPTTAYKSKIIRFKMDKDPLQRKIYFVTFVEIAWDDIFIVQRNLWITFRLSKNSKGIILLKIMQKRTSGTFCVQNLMYTAEDWLMNPQNTE